jgi:hypothetical protein
MNGLGYIHTEDVRDRNYPMAAVLPAEEPPADQNEWPLGSWIGNQGSKPACVGFAFGGWLFAGPTANRRQGDEQEIPSVKPIVIWRNAQKLNPEQGSIRPTEGANTTYAAEYLRRRGFIESYYNVEGASGFTNAQGQAKTRAAVDAITKALLTKGPVVIGGPWFPAMFTPKEDGYLRVPADQHALQSGGHAWLAYGVDLSTGDPEVDHIQMLNSWGRNWGGKAGLHPGTALIPISLLTRLFTYSAKAHLAIEKVPVG